MLDSTIIVLCVVLFLHSSNSSENGTFYELKELCENTLCADDCNIDKLDPTDMRRQTSLMPNSKQ